MPAKFPVELSDQEGIVDAVNYLLSGPAGLGQNFSGFSDFNPAWLTGNFRTPYTVTTPANLYVAPISLSTAEMLDERTYKFTFASTQPSIPFPLGNGVKVSGVSDSWYDGWYFIIGVVECTTDYVIVRFEASYPVEPPSTGGTIELTTTGDFYSATDANGKVTVTGGTDRVFTSAQLDNTISYDVSAGPADLEYTVAVNRYKGSPNLDPINPEYGFAFDKTISKKYYYVDGLTGTGSLSLIETVFTSVIDTPPPGYYWYIVEVKFYSYTGGIEVTQSEFTLRSFTAQVVKQ